jgi:hypothetical protein
MRINARIPTVAGVSALAAVCTVGLLAGPANASPAHTARGATNRGSTHAHLHRYHHSHRFGVVFAQTDNLAGNAVVSYRRGTDGSLTESGVYPTGGLGGQLSGSVVDHTASQGALAYDAAHHLLYAVNAGSNTITAFAVHGTHLVRIQTVGSGGTFPVSITVHDGLLYVLNARGGASLQGFVRWGGLLIRIPAWHRDLGFDPDATPEFTSTPGQVAFTPDGSKLIVTTKGDGQSIEVFPVSPFGPSLRPVVTADPGNVPFAIAFDQQDNLVIAEAGPSAIATFRVNRDATLTLVNRASTGQAATCWVTTTGADVYASNAGSANVSDYTDSHGVLSGGGTTATDPGTVDSAASRDGRFLYVQTGATGVIDEYAIAGNGALTKVGSVTVPDGVGGEGIAAG